MRTLIYCFAFSIFITPAYASKDQYTLFNPTPKELMREMSTDRPDKTESPYTVDAGHYQIETSFLDYAYDKEGGQTTETYGILPTNFKVGLLNNMDLQLVVSPYIAEQSQGAKDKNGFGDLQTRLKVNLWGNDEGPTALALMPYMKFPTNGAQLGNNDLEGGLIVPLAVGLPGEWGFGIMTQFDAVKDDEGGDYHAEFINSATVSHAICGNLSGYLEFFSKVSNESKSAWEGTVDAGLTYAVTEDIQLDMGINTGVTRAADDINPFIGMSARY